MGLARRVRTRACTDTGYQASKEPFWALLSRNGALLPLFLLFLLLLLLFLLLFLLFHFLLFLLLFLLFLLLFLLFLLLPLGQVSLCLPS